jgi:hypothetical protein
MSMSMDMSKEMDLEKIPMMRVRLRYYLQIGNVQA